MSEGSEIAGGGALGGGAHPGSGAQPSSFGEAPDEAALEALVGRWALLRPADGQPVLAEDGPRSFPGSPPAGSTGGGKSGGGPGGSVLVLAGVVLADDAVEAAIMGLEDGALRCETRDRRAGGLEGRPVMVELGSPSALVQVPGLAQVLGAWPLPVVLLVHPTGPLLEFQRRSWVRVPAVVPVEVAVSAEGQGGQVGEALATVSRDVSAGGCRLELVEGLERLRPGDERQVVLQLPGGPLELAARVVGRGERDRTLRMAFVDPPEAARKRLARFVFDVQLRLRRGQDP